MPIRAIASGPAETLCGSATAAAFTRRITGLSFKLRDLAQSPLVSTAVEFGAEPHFDHSLHALLSDQVGRQAEHVDIIVSAADLGGHFIVTRRGSNARHLVGSDRHSNSGAANQDASISFLLRNLVSDDRSDVGIVDAIGGVGAYVDRLMAQSSQEIDELPLELDSTMVIANRDTHLQFSGRFGSGNSAAHTAK